MLEKTGATCDLTRIDLASIENRQENKCRTQFVIKPSKNITNITSQFKLLKKTYANWLSKPANYH